MQFDLCMFEKKNINIKVHKYQKLERLIDNKRYFSPL